jgi:predicted nucleotidyltransferase
MKSIASWTGSSTDTELLRRCKKVITSLAGDADIILYGSRARGNARQDSDYDILVIANRPVNMALEEKIVGGVFYLEIEAGRVITLIVYDKQQWNSPLYKAMPFHKNIDREGVLL